MDRINTFIDSLPRQLERDHIVPIVSIAAATTLLFSTYKLFSNRNHKGLTKIPVPRGGYPYFGHMFSVGTDPSRKFAEWHKESGPILQIRMGIQTWVLIADPEIAHKVFVTNGVHSSHRPHNTFTNIYSHNGRGIGFSPPEKHWRDARAAVISIITPKYVDTNYMVPITREASDLAERLIQYSKREGGGTDPMIHLHLNSMNIIYMSAFGKRFESVEDEEFRTVSAVVLKQLSLAGPEHDMASFFPILAIVEYLTGKTKKMNDFINNERDPLFKSLITEALRREDTNLAQELEKFDFDDKAKLVIMSDLIAAGTDTISVTLCWVFAIMCNYPQVQKRAAAEIDHFVSLYHRLPLFSERNSLPYCISMLKECMRFKPTTPFGLPHQADQDIIVDNYLIPKGATLVSCMESMHMNPKVYDEPERFCAERFSDNLQLMDTAAKGKLEGRDHYNFGWGRRMCAGIYMAEAELFVSFVNVIARCSIEPVVDSTGKEHFPNIEQAVNSGITLTPESYKVNFVERTPDL
ncbi:cytochrome P450 [Helicostylum pulchrum]|uniref:Cytochrome P450 n=1 Tax=Helicostylum pulchrum TaxID=562976 RepID=A0ABP9YC69_9FUNG|nr:cytochrome P450 [Helicostylum pulchrum]